MGRLDGKVAIITGAGSGLGAACSGLFAREGAKVVVADIHDARGAEVVSAIKEAGGEATFVHTDVTKSEDVQRAVQTAEERYGKLNIMVPNAGILGKSVNFSTAEMDDKEWDITFNVNSTGVMRCFKYAIPAIRRAGGGAMSATASPSGITRWGGTLSAYGASKAAVIRLVKDTAYECLKDNIRVNCVCPGSMLSRLGESGGRSPEESGGRASAAGRGRRCGPLLLQRTRSHRSRVRAPVPLFGRGVLRKRPQSHSRRRLRLSRDGRAIGPRIFTHNGGLNMGRLDGKVAVITGASSGLGAACSRLFAREGATIVAADIHDARGAEIVSAVKEAGGEATFVHTDVTKSEEVQRAVQTAEERYGKLNIMVANAGITGKSSTMSTAQMDEKEWDFTFNVDSTGVMRCFKYAIPAIRRAGGGAMSATASPSGLTRWGSTLAAYGAAKAAVIRLVKDTAYECLQDNIRVNCVCPGSMDSRLYESRGMSEAEMAAIRAQRQKPDPNLPYYARSRDPIEVAYAHLFLCSDEASFVNGHNLIADGGFDFRGTEGR